jgi:hypothetical protein
MTNLAENTLERVVRLDPTRELSPDQLLAAKEELMTLCADVYEKYLSHRLTYIDNGEFGPYIAVCLAVLRADGSWLRFQVNINHTEQGMVYRVYAQAVEGDSSMDYSYETSEGDEVGVDCYVVYDDPVITYAKVQNFLVSMAGSSGEDDITTLDDIDEDLVQMQQMDRRPVGVAELQRLRRLIEMGQPTDRWVQL